MDDAHLVAALKANEPAALGQVIDAFGDRLLRSATLLCGNQTEAQDLVQETFLQAFSSIRRFRGEASLYTWLHGILLNLVRHYHRRRHRLIYDDEPAKLLCVQPNSIVTTDADIASSALIKAMGELSLDHREVLVLRYYDDMKIDAMARHLGISKGTVKSRLHYAISAMQRLLPSEMNLFRDGGTIEMEQ